MTKDRALYTLSQTVLVLSIVINLVAIGVFLWRNNWQTAGSQSVFLTLPCLGYWILNRAKAYTWALYEHACTQLETARKQLAMTKEMQATFASVHGLSDDDPDPTEKKH